MFFNKAVSSKVISPAQKRALDTVEYGFTQKSAAQAALVQQYLANEADTSLVPAMRNNLHQMDADRKAYKMLLKKASPSADTNDTNYVFLRFVIDHLPQGLVGLLIAVIFLSAWGSIAAALNALSGSTLCDLHQVYSKRKLNNEQEYRLSKWYTFWWGLFCIVVAQFANNMGSLVEAVNVLGSIFYGVLLGIFLLAFFFPRVKGTPAFYSAVITQVFIFILFWKSSIGFLWLNVIGALALVLLALLLHVMFQTRKLLTGK
ncbi:MAG: hypothetical protein QM664_04500 [Flavihumibacter sp.]